MPLPPRHSTLPNSLTTSALEKPLKDNEIITGAHKVDE